MLRLLIPLLWFLLKPVKPRAKNSTPKAGFKEEREHQEGIKWVRFYINCELLGWLGEPKSLFRLMGACAFHQLPSSMLPATLGAPGHRELGSSEPCGQPAVTQHKPLAGDQRPRTPGEGPSTSATRAPA